MVTHPSVLGGSPFIIALALVGTLEKKFGLHVVEEGQEAGRDSIHQP